MSGEKVLSPAAERSSSRNIDLTKGEWSNQRHSVEATAKEGYMCHITMKAQLDLTPEQMFAVFTHPDNSHVFRDLGHTVKYKVVEDNGRGQQKIDIEQQAVFKFLAIPIKFSTRLTVDVDFENLQMSFKLAKWGTMRKFEGQWDMSPILGENGEVVGTKAQLTQDVLPLIVPPFLKNFLSGVSANVVRRLLEDFEVIAKRVREGENLTNILGWSKWMEKNPTLKKWREEQDTKWAKKNSGVGVDEKSGAVAKEIEQELKDTREAGEDLNVAAESQMEVETSTEVSSQNDEVNAEGGKDCSEVSSGNNKVLNDSQKGAENCCSSCHACDSSQAPANSVGLEV